MDDEIVKDISEEYTKLDELKDDIRKGLTLQEENKAQENLVRELENSLISRYDFDLPPNMVEDYLGNLVAEIKKGSKEPVDESYLKNVYRPEAVRNLRWHFIRKKLISHEQITVEDDEVNVRIEELAGQQNMEKEKALKLLRSKKNQERLKDQLIEEKIRNLLQQSAEVMVEEVD